MVNSQLEMSGLPNFINEEQVERLKKGDKITFNPDRENNHQLSRLTKHERSIGWYILFGLILGKKYTFNSYEKDRATGNLLINVEERMANAEMRTNSKVYFKYYGIG
jgi:hypothetical protein